MHLWYSRTSISGGARDGEHSDTSPFPCYTCAKKAKNSRTFLYGINFTLVLQFGD